MFNRVTEIILPFFKSTKDKKREFLEKLRGRPYFRVKKNTPYGAIFILKNKQTGHIDSYGHLAVDHWVSWGTSTTETGELTQVFTTRQLEIHLTGLVRKATKKDAITLVDESKCLEWVTP